MEALHPREVGMRALFRLCAVASTLALCSSGATAQTMPPPAPVPTASAVPTASPTSIDIAGTWDAIQRSYGGIGSTIILSHDSAFTLVLGAMVDLRYKTTRDKFTFFSDQPGHEHSESQDLRFVGGNAVLSGNGCSRKLTRMDPQGADTGLVGRWKSMHMTGVPAYEDYTADGTTRLRVPIQVQKGTFSVVGSAVMFHTLSPSPEDWSAGFALAGDTLTFSIRTEQHKYLRARPLIPADVQQPVRPERMRC